MLGIWIEQTEGAKFWLRVMNELKNRGVEDILIAGVDGLKGFPEAIETVFPKTAVQTCIVHMVRNAWTSSVGNRKAAGGGAEHHLYRRPAEEAKERLDDFDAGPWGRRTTPPSPRPGGEIGRASFRSSTTRRRSGT